MKKIELKNLDKTCYQETLSNGLDIFMVPYEDKKNYFISYATRFGSEVLEFTSGKKTYKPPLGIAHFLEHKMFEQEDGKDPFTFFSESGTGSNASTSFDNTQYICYGTKNFEENLKYLLKFVNSPYYTDENVEKEKGIIAEEIKMYEDIPEFKLEMKIREAIYKNNPRRIDIAGTIPEINKITKEDLYACYDNFYNPANMFILIVGNFQPNDALKIINQEVGNIENKSEGLRETIKEPTQVNEAMLTLKENIEVPKIAFGLKVPTKGLKMKELELDLYLNILTTVLFGSSSEFRERVRKKKLLTNIYTEWESTDKFRVFYIMATTTQPDSLIEEINNELKNLEINESSFERIKKVWIANEVKMIDSIDATVNNVYDDILKYKKIIPNKIEIIRSMELEKLNEVISKINLKNTSIIKMLDN